jgi:hypothetical protein
MRGDFGEQTPSDLDDESPAVEVIMDDDRVSLGTSPVTTTGAVSCCDMANRAFKNAQRALEQAERALRAMKDIANQQTPDVPPECGGEQFTCTARVIVSHIIPTIVKKPNDGPISSTPGQNGRVVASVPNGSVCYTFNSAEAAREFGLRKLAERDEKQANYQFVVGKDDEFGIQFISPDLGLKPPPRQTERCDEPAPEDRGIVGRRDDRIDKNVPLSEFN